MLAPLDVVGNDGDDEYSILHSCSRHQLEWLEAPVTRCMDAKHIHDMFLINNTPLRADSVCEKRSKGPGQAVWVLLLAQQCGSCCCLQAKQCGSCCCGAVRLCMMRVQFLSLHMQPFQCHKRTGHSTDSDLCTLSCFLFWLQNMQHVKS